MRAFSFEKLSVWKESLLGLFYPTLCLICEEQLVRGEEFICSACRVALPKTHFHLQADNPVEELFWGRCRVERATAFLTFLKEGSAQVLLHQLKYRGKKELGRDLGYWFGSYLLESDFAACIDALLPLPLHPRKERQRGFNQAEWIARGLAECLQLPMENQLLSRVKNTATQTHRSRYDRWLNVEDAFQVTYPEAARDRHFLLVDDVITTGATLESAVHTLNQIPGCRISIATLAYAPLS